MIKPRKKSSSHFLNGSPKRQKTRKDSSDVVKELFPRDKITKDNEGHSVVAATLPLLENQSHAIHDIQEKLSHLL